MTNNIYAKSDDIYYAMNHSHQLNNDIKIASGDMLQ